MEQLKEGVHSLGDSSLPSAQSLVPSHKLKAPDMQPVPLGHDSCQGMGGG